jgi:cytochrome c553
MRLRLAWDALLLSLLVIPRAAEAGDAAAGQAKAAATCIVCHGPDGISKVPDAPHLAGQPEQYLVAQLKAYRKKKRTNEIMNVIAKTLNDSDIANLAAWFSSIEVRAQVPK